MAVLVSLPSCTTAPVEETKSFVDAVSAVKSAGDLLWDELAIAERRNHQTLVKRNPAKSNRFYVSDAPYFATIGEPPATATFKYSLELVKQYSSLLLSLAEGRDIEKARSQLLAISSSIGELAKATALAPIAAQLAPLIDHALKAYSIAEARRIVFEGEPIINDILVSMRDATPLIFETLVIDLKLHNPANASVDKYRMTVSNFVMLLESLRAALGQLRIAYQKSSSPASLIVLAQLTANINADVAAARKAFAIARRGS